jgi:hypothetical protein
VGHRDLPRTFGRARRCESFSYSSSSSSSRTSRRCHGYRSRISDAVERPVVAIAAETIEDEDDDEYEDDLALRASSR